MKIEADQTRRIGLELLLVFGIELVFFVLSTILKRQGILPVLLFVFGLPAVLALLFGNERLARLTFGYLAGLLGFFSVLSLGSIFTVPAGLLLAELRLRTLMTLPRLISHVVDIGLTLLICLQLSRAVKIRRRYWLPFVAGALMAGVGPLVSLVSHAHDPNQLAAMAKARQLYGSQYEYCFGKYLSFDRQNRRFTSALVIGYNNKEIRDINIDFSKSP